MILDVQMVKGQKPCPRRFIKCILQKKASRIKFNLTEFMHWMRVVEESHDGGIWEPRPKTHFKFIIVKPQLKPEEALKSCVHLNLSPYYIPRFKVYSFNVKICNLTWKCNKLAPPEKRTRRTTVSKLYIIIPINVLRLTMSLGLLEEGPLRFCYSALVA